MKVNEKLVFETALKAVACKGLNVQPLQGNGKGRPSSNMMVGDVVLNGEEYRLYTMAYEFGTQCRNMIATELMTEEEMLAKQKLAAPIIMDRMINLALVSDDLKALKMIYADLTDRGFGKAADRVDLTVSHKDIRNVWKQMESKKLPMTDTMPVIDVVADEYEVEYCDD